MPPVALSVQRGNWIRVPVPGSPWPVHFHIAGTFSAPAFIDHEMRGSEVQTIAAIRCPDLPPGNYDLKVELPDGIIVRKIRVA